MAFGFLKVELQASSELPRGCWESILDLQQEQEVLLSTELLLQCSLFITREGGGK